MDVVLILDGNSAIGAHVRINLSYLIRCGVFIRSGAVINRKFFLRKDLFSFMREQDVISYHLKSTMALNLFKKVFKKTHTFRWDFYRFFWLVLGIGLFLANSD